MRFVSRVNLNRVAREFESGLRGELAALLRHAGYTVILVMESRENA
jgi:hypothetical protein